MITSEGKAHFDTFGWLTIDQLFPPNEIAEITQRFDKIMDDDLAGNPLPEKLEIRQSVYGILERDLLESLPDDDRIYSRLESFLGPGFNYSCSEGQLYNGDTPWHPDGSNLKLNRIKVAIYLDSVTRETGALRIVPGSHRLPFHTDLDPLRLQRDDPSASPFGADGTEIPAFALEMRPSSI